MLTGCDDLNSFRNSYLSNNHQVIQQINECNYSYNHTNRKSNTIVLYQDGETIGIHETALINVNGILLVRIQFNSMMNSTMLTMIASLFPIE